MFLHSVQCAHKRRRFCLAANWKKWSKNASNAFGHWPMVNRLTCKKRKWQFVFHSFADIFFLLSSGLYSTRRLSFWLALAICWPFLIENQIKNKVFPQQLTCQMTCITCTRSSQTTQLTLFYLIVCFFKKERLLQ